MSRLPGLLRDAYREPHPFLRGGRPFRMFILYFFLLPEICVVTLAELLAGFGSKLGELTAAMFVTDSLFADPAICTVMVTVAEPPLAMFPKLQVTVPTWSTAGAVHNDPPEFIDTNVDSSGTGSFNVTVDAWNGPQIRHSHCVKSGSDVVI